MLAEAMRAAGHDPVVPRCGMGARTAPRLQRLQPQPGRPPLLVVATGPYARERLDGPALDTLLLATPIRRKRDAWSSTPGRILRPYPGKQTADLHDYHDFGTGVLDATLAGRSPATPASAPDPRYIPFTPSATSTSQ